MLVFFFNDTATTEIYTLSLHDALPISMIFELGETKVGVLSYHRVPSYDWSWATQTAPGTAPLLKDVMREDIERLRSERSEEHTSELQSRQYLVCRLLLEKKKNCTPIIS